MKFRILLRSFDNELINVACEELRTTLLKTDCLLTGVVSLPIKIKRFCVLRSPHIDKDSREHFEIRLYKRFIDLTTTTPAVLDLLLKTELPAGISCSIKILTNQSENALENESKN
jgi:small subunit ribosomal protein S10